MPTLRAEMDAAYDEWDAQLQTAPTLAALYARLKDSERDARLSLAQKAILHSLYRHKMQEEGWQW